MYWIVALLIAITPCSGPLCQLAQPASPPFLQQEDCDRERKSLVTWGGDGTVVTLQDAARAGTSTTLTLTWACVPASLMPPSPE
jgi:hypothetical protein